MAGSQHTRLYPVGTDVVSGWIPSIFRIMNKPESEDEQAVMMDE